MYELRWVRDEDGINTNLGRFPTYEEAWEAIQAWWTMHDYKPSYVRKSGDEDYVVEIDYGLHDAKYMIVHVEPFEPSTYVCVDYRSNGDGVVFRYVEYDELMTDMCVVPGSHFRVGDLKVKYDKVYTRQHFDRVMNEIRKSLDKAKPAIEKRNRDDDLLSWDHHTVLFTLDEVICTEDSDTAEELLGEEEEEESLDTVPYVSFSALEGDEIEEFLKLFTKKK